MQQAVEMTCKTRYMDEFLFASIHRRRCIAVIKFQQENLKGWYHVGDLDPDGNLNSKTALKARTRTAFISPTARIWCGF
jgi:hypothetical protein